MWNVFLLSLCVSKGEGREYILYNDFCVWREKKDKKIFKILIFKWNRV